MRDDFLVFGSPLIEQAEIDEVVSAMKSGWIGSGPRVARFEEEFREYKSARYSAAVNSCTAALHLSMICAGIRPGDEVITTPLTFCATINAIIHCGAKPVLADIDPETMNIDPASIEEKISGRSKAVLPVHFAGRPCEMDRIMAFADKNGLKVIEDCAHAIESIYKGRHAGTFGDFGCFSFYVTKNLATGEGGMVLCPDYDNICQVKTLALHGLSCDAWKRFSDSGYKHYFVINPGYKYNMMDIQAAMGIHQLSRVEKNLSRREEIWSVYDKELSGLPLKLPAAPEPGTRHARHLYTILILDEAPVSRDQFLQKMHERNIGTGVHYMSIPEHEFYQDAFLWRPEDYPCAMYIGRRTVSLPLSAKLSESDVADVVEAVRDVLRG